VLDKLLAKELAYQNLEKGSISYLSEKKKKYWLIFSLDIGSYSLQNKKQEKKEEKNLKEICLCSGASKSHDP
jgi:hypothetical protein